MVRSPLDIQTLSSRGCFGKGIFSRSVPTHGRLPPSPGEGRQRRDEAGGEVLERFELTQRKRIDLHGQWKKKWDEKAEEEKRHGEERSEQQRRQQQEKQLLEDVDRLEGTEEPFAVKHPQLPEASCRLEGGNTVECILDGSEGTTAATPALDSTMEASAVDSTFTQITEERRRYSRFVQQMESLAESDPYKVTEYLQLGSEEAFYLVQELGELTVWTTPTEGASPHICSPAELWCTFREANCRFLERYIAYRYFRQKGWVPKSGLKCGVDFLLYKEGPAVYHSSYAVIVKLVDPPLGTTSPRDVISSTSTEGRDPPQLTWQEVMSHCRVSESVAKDLLVCYVMQLAPPAALPSGDWRNSPDCVADFTVCEVLVRRWVPDRERSAK